MPKVLLSLAALAAAVLVHRPGLAYPLALLDEERLGPRLEQIDVDRHELWVETRRRSPFWIAVDANYTKSTDGWRSVTAMLLFGMPLERVTSLSRATRFAEGADGGKPVLKPPLPPPRPRGEPPPPKLPEAAPSPPERIPVPVVITPAVARAAVKAALRRAQMFDPAARIDALASRARTSAVLPELRLRVARIVDDGQSLMPTEYDPTRVTATGGTTLWLDARATWRLDRLVFADEEVPLERMRHERAEAQAKLVKRVLEALFSWQKGMARMGDPAATAEQHLAATLQVLEAEAELDLMTDGWFTRWRAAK
jgi:hypothetical protein